ncbi:hypothetical protein ACFL4A_03065, partial [bacterium]
IRSIKNTKARNELIEHFTQKGYFSGPEIYKSKNNNDIKLFGVEDFGLYVKNFRALEKALSYKDELERIIKCIENDIYVQKKKHYTNELKRFYEIRNRYKNSKIGLAVYLNFLNEQVISYGINTNRKYKNINLVIRALKQRSLRQEIQKKVDKIKLIKEIGQLEYKILVSMNKNNQEMLKLLDVEKKLKILSAFIRTKATSENAKLWLENKEEYLKILKKYLFKMNRYSTYIEEAKVITKLEKYMTDFYKAANARNEYLVNNLFKTGKSEKYVLVAGGYHVSGITQILRSRGINYKVIIPNTDNCDIAKAKKLYMERFNHQSKWLTSTDAEPKLVPSSPLHSMMLVSELYKNTKFPNSEIVKFVEKIDMKPFIHRPSGFIKFVNWVEENKNELLQRYGEDFSNEPPDYKQLLISLTEQNDKVLILEEADFKDIIIYSCDNEQKKQIVITRNLLDELTEIYKKHNISSDPLDDIYRFYIDGNNNPELQDFLIEVTTKNIDEDSILSEQKEQASTAVLDHAPYKAFLKCKYTAAKVPKPSFLSKVSEHLQKISKNIAQTDFSDKQWYKAADENRHDYTYDTDTKVDINPQEYPDDSLSPPAHEYLTEGSLVTFSASSDFLTENFSPLTEALESQNIIVGVEKVHGQPIATRWIRDKFIGTRDEGVISIPSTPLTFLSEQYSKQLTDSLGYSLFPPAPSILTGYGNLSHAQTSIPWITVSGYKKRAKEAQIKFQKAEVPIDGGNLIAAINTKGETKYIIGNRSLPAVYWYKYQEYLKSEELPGWNDDLSSLSVSAMQRKECKIGPKDRVDEAKEQWHEPTMAGFVEESLGIPDGQSVVTPHPGFHLDIGIRPGPNGTIFMADFNESLKVLEELKNTTPSLVIDDMIVAIDDMIETQEKLKLLTENIIKQQAQILTKAGFEIQRVPGMFFTTLSNRKIPVANYMNAISGHGKQGHFYYGQSFNEYLDTAFRNIIRKHYQNTGFEAQDVRLFGNQKDNIILLQNSGGLRCQYASIPGEFSIAEYLEHQDEINAWLEKQDSEAKAEIEHTRWKYKDLSDQEHIDSISEDILLWPQQSIEYFVKSFEKWIAKCETNPKSKNEWRDWYLRLEGIKKALNCIYEENVSDKNLAMPEQKSHFLIRWKQSLQTKSRRFISQTLTRLKTFLTRIAKPALNQAEILFNTMFKDTKDHYSDPALLKACQMAA